MLSTSCALPPPARSSSRDNRNLILGLEAPKASVVPFTPSRLGALWALANSLLKFDVVAGCDDGDVFRRLTHARLIEPASKLDAACVLGEAGIPAPSEVTLKRRLLRYADTVFREGVAAANADHVGPGPCNDLPLRRDDLVFRNRSG